jgi:hypothetical protein
MNVARELLGRIRKLHLEPGDFIVLEFPAEVYRSRSALRDATLFADNLAQITARDVIIVQEGVRLYVATATGSPHK